MGRLRSWVKRLERARRRSQDGLVIEQADGTMARFPKGAWEEAFMHEAERLRAIHRGEDPGEAHPVTVARRTARAPEPLTFDADRQPRKPRYSTRGTVT
jgi:hypothetical protein